MSRLLLSTALCLVTLPVFAGTWKPLRIGAGGYVTQMDVQDNGGTTVVLIGTDTHGAFLWDAGSSTWLDIVSHDSMPSADVDANTSAGGYAVCIAPNDGARFYLGFGGYYYVTSDSGGSWTQTDFPNNYMNANDQANIQRIWNQRCAVDPADKDHVLVGVGYESGEIASGGMWRSTDGGTNFTELTALPTPSTAGVTGITFDHNSALVGGLTGIVYAGINGTGVYRSTDAGATWSVLSGGPTNVLNATISEDGIYYCTDNASPHNVWSWASGTGWTDETPSVQNRTWLVALVDPADNDRWVISDEGAIFTQTTDGGVNWDAIDWTDKTRTANDIPWLAWTEETYMSVGSMEWDPNVTNQVWFSQGIGVWTFSYPSSPASPLVMTSRSKGIEQLIANDIIAPAGRTILTASWDRPIFYSTDQDVFPSTHGPDRDNAINHGWSIAVDPQDADRVVAVINKGGAGNQRTGYSSDGGQTWTTFAVNPFGTDAWGGNICVNGPDNVLWVNTDDGPQYSTDNGASWTEIVLPGWSGTTWDRMHGEAFLRRKIFTADPDDADTFYMYALHEDTSSLSGMFKTVDAGATWTKQSTTEFGGMVYSFWNGKLKAVPGHGGHLVWTNGDVGGSIFGSLYYSDDGGATFSTFPDVLEAKDFGFSAAAPGETYPALAFAGWNHGVWGIWRTDDPTVADPVWVNIGTHPHDWLDQVVTMTGDPDVYDRWYIGWAGGGFSYYDPSVLGDPGIKRRGHMGSIVLP